VCEKFVECLHKDFIVRLVTDFLILAEKHNAAMLKECCNFAEMILFVTGNIC